MSDVTPPTPEPSYTPPPAAPAAPVQPAYAAAPASERYNTLAIVGFILAFFTTVIGLIISAVALSQIKKSGEKGRGFAIAGIIIGAIGIVVGIIIIIVYSVLAAALVSDGVIVNG